MRGLLSGMAVVCLAAVSASGENDVRIIDGGLRFWNRQFEIWGAQVPDWQRLVTDPRAVLDTYQVLADRGVNTVGVTLQSAIRHDSLFGPDGRPADPETAKRFTRLTAHVRDHALACVVNLFSSDRSCWLKSEEAYRQAVQTAVRLLDVKHTTVFVVGDIFSNGQWSAECPYPMRDPDKVIELCRLMDQTRPEALVGIPADLVYKKATMTRPSRPLFYFADTADALQKLVDGSQSAAAVGRPPVGVICVDADHFFRLADAGDHPEKALAGYLSEVERRRLAVSAPLRATAGPSGGKLLTPEEKAEGFVPLFNGYNLEGWTTLRSDWATWSVHDGVITCSGADGQWLRTRKRYASFILRLDFKIVKDGNSGIFVWSPLEARSSRFGMEMQILGVRRDKPNADTTGAIYDVLPPLENPIFKINDWNSVEITCRGSKVRMTLNGRVIQDFDADQVPKLKGRLRRGVIGLQDHGQPVWFRQIRIKDLGSAG
jgi:hypothetical protein